MKIKPKISAFTLNELIIVLILTSIVVGLAFSVLSLVTKQISSVRKNYSKKIELEKLQTALYTDFNTYSNIHTNNNNIVLKNNLKQINYTITQSYIARNKDTFFIPTQNVSFYFNGQPAVNGKIDAITIETSKAFNNSKIFTFKHNDAATFMN